MIQLPDPPLLLITDRTMVRVSLDAALERAFAGNCRWVMVREKDLDETERLSLVESVMQIAEPFGVKVVVNSDLKAGAIADGVHLPQGQSCTNARTVLGPDKIIGVSAHTIGEAGAAASSGADYATISPIFPTQSKPGYGPPLYLDGLAKAVGRVQIPL
ncbi:MAG: thiamine phosphate synthase, partial [Pseudomonadota bacterium]|nr:thiamine phosphate synthase [Pseudomonadota bacterium]